MITTSEIRKGTTFEMDGNLYQVVEVHHVKTKRSAVYRVKMRDLRAGHITEHSFNAGEKLATARVERRDMQYLYADEDNLTFMNTETYDQIGIAAVRAQLAEVRRRGLPGYQAYTIAHATDGEWAEVTREEEDNVAAIDELKKLQTVTGIFFQAASHALRGERLPEGLRAQIRFLLG